MTTNNTIASETPPASAVITTIATGGSGAAPPLAGAITAPVPDMRARALALAKQGFKVFRLEVNGKKPAVAEWPKRASSDLAEVSKMWTDFGGDSLFNNVGILCGEHFMVLDVDTKNGKRGDESLATLEDMGLSLATLTAISPTGSRHFFYRLPKGRTAGNTAGKLGDGLDTKGHHGMVVGAGSVVPAGEYAWLSKIPMIEAPGWLLDMCAKRAAPDVDPRDVLVDLDDDAAIARAREWLLKSAPEAVEGAAGDETTFKVCCRIKDFGISRDVALELLCDWNAEKASPPWSIDELQQKIANAFAYGSLPAGVSSARADFTAVDIAESRQRPGRQKLFLRSFEEACQRSLNAPARPLIKKLLGCGEMSVLYGDSGGGKTFTALDMALHIASGIPWNGKKTLHAPVIYLAAEAGDGLNMRLEAWRRHHKPETPPLLYVMPCIVDMFDPTVDLRALIETIRGAGERAGQAVALVVVDTLARVMASGDENSTRDMGLFVRNADKIRVDTGAHIMIVHHTGKDKFKGARGSSALRAATDTEIEIVNNQIKETKQRSWQAGRPVGFELRSVELGHDEDGERVTSCVVELKNDVAIPLAPTAKKMLEAAE